MHYELSEQEIRNLILEYADLEYIKEKVQTIDSTLFEYLIKYKRMDVIMHFKLPIHPIGLSCQLFEHRDKYTIQTLEYIKNTGITYFIYESNPSIPISTYMNFLKNIYEHAKHIPHSAVFRSIFCLDHEKMVEILIFALDLGFIPDSSVYGFISNSCVRQMVVLSILWNRGCPFDENTLSSVCVPKTSFKVAKWLIKRDCPYTLEILIANYSVNKIIKLFPERKREIIELCHKKY
jgi:hypothetical protein